jgi:uncharacterized repeat protein (TIGR03803 family)
MKNIKIFKLLHLIVAMVLIQTTVLAQYVHPNQAGQKGGQTGPGTGKQVVTTTYFGFTFDNAAQGTIVSVNKDGTNATALHGFKGFPSDGSFSWYTTPHKASDGNIYGASYVGGSSNWGSVYSYNFGTGTEGVIYNNAPGSGGSPGNFANVNELSDGKIYTVQTVGGSQYLGGIYSMNKDGSGLALIHSFQNTTVNYTAAASAQLSGQTQLDGRLPYGFVVEGVDGKIYGSTLSGGAYNRGAFYRLDKDGSNYEIINVSDPALKSYVNGKGGLIPLGYNLNDPYGNVAIDQQGRVYITANAGGVANLGGVARMNADGSNYQLLHSGNAAEGANPYRGALIIDGRVYGTYRFLGGASTAGGAASGVVYGMDLDGSNYKILKAFDSPGSVFPDGAQPWAGLSYDGEFLFGTTIIGGGAGKVGTIYKVRPDGSGFQTVHRFSETAETPCGGKPSIFSWYPSAERVTFADVFLNFSQTCIPDLVCNAGNDAPVFPGGNSVSNTCGTTAVDLTNLTASNQPSGTQVEWHTSSTISSATRVPDPTQVIAGTYYAIFFDAINGCYASEATASTAVTVTINPSPFCFAPPLISALHSNVCDVATADLTTLPYGNTPSGATITWHTGSPATDANKIATPDAVTANTYYAAYYNGSTYGPVSDPVVVTVISCGNTDVNASCPANTADLSSYFTGSPPANTILTWHSGKPATQLNQIADPTAAIPGTYYPAYLDQANNCYGTAGAPVTVVACAMPVTLIRFEARQENGVVDLLWATSEETNSDHFEVQHSTNGKDWIAIGRVTASKESIVRKEYTFPHTIPTTGVNYYRLKMVDQDDTFSYSRIAATKIYGDVIAIYPNPATETVRVNESLLAVIKSLKIVNTAGITVYQDQKISTSEVSVKQLESGTYLMVFTHKDGSVHTHKLVISK